MMLPRYHNRLSRSGKAASETTTNKTQLVAGGSVRKAGKIRRNCGLGLVSVALLNLTACNTAPVNYAGDLYSVADFYGGVVADEPRAALVGRDILANGGDAADAMVAMYFTMAVTMPSAASLGGGGVCIAHEPVGDKNKSNTQVIDFLPRMAAGGKVAVPGNVRGMAALWAGFGKLQWAQLVAPGEKLATAGTPASRALANDVAAAGPILRDDPQMAGLFVTPEGRPLGEADNLRQAQLGAVLGQIRARGAGAFYSGPLAQRLVDAAQAIGAPLTVDDLRDFKASMYSPLQVPLGDQTVYLPQPPASGGVTTAQMLNVMGSAPKGKDSETQFLASASMRLMADRSNWMKPGGEATREVADLVSSNHTSELMSGYQPGRVIAASALVPPAQRSPENPWSVNAVAADLNGMAIACTFTMNALFGAGRLAGDTGIILAPAPNDQGAGFSALAPMIVANQHNGEFYYASAASGGMPGAIAQAVILHRVMGQDVPLDKAILAPRVFHNGEPDKVFYEDGADVSALTAAGFQVEQRNGLGRVNAIYCPGGAPTKPDSCVMRNDYRGNGLASFYSKH
ncbi:gamma-glutamyltransferase [Dongia soli]|uniref:Gamma-glutamyltransferase n=1 Tax=Dongia soli TaxID=600628 RepID=A0ABU5EC09_9PROT|nr:gamma-glutamyltransferase [Dongia soli]MDY0883706.1 gamma-glutamyltransferase [Dongia soli]